MTDSAKPSTTACSAPPRGARSGRLPEGQLIDYVTGKSVNGSASQRKRQMLDKPDNTPSKAISPELLGRFAAIVGEKFAITDPQSQTPYLVEMRDLFRGHTPAVLRPGTVEEVAAILKLANETKTPIVPQGGNTGLVGGQIPHHNEIALSVNRIDRIREVDPASNTITVESGVTLQRTREAAAAVDRLYPQLLPSEGPSPTGANSPPKAAAPGRWGTASHARTRSGLKWCSPTAACSTIST